MRVYLPLVLAASLVFSASCAHPGRRTLSRGPASLGSLKQESNVSEKEPGPHPLVDPQDAQRPKPETVEEKLWELSSTSRVTPLCDTSLWPLEFRFADYSLTDRGIVVQDGGWSSQQRELYTGFLCKMFPVLQEVYGSPFVKYPVTLVKDARYASSNVFVIRDKTIRTDGVVWNPQLLTHELVHAFRGDWTLTKADNYSQYSPTLSGYEEGFAQAVSYEAMNRYIERWGTDLYVSRNFLWWPETEWNYDFKNDSSMVTEEFWSDLGGTRKYFERYEQAATVMAQLSVQIPDFYRRFNESYYARIRTNPKFRPTKDAIHSVIVSLVTHPALAQALPGWFSKQNILQCKTVFGKKVWSITVPSSLAEPIHHLYFVETFPNGSEWAYRLDGGDYLYHRLNSSTGTIGVNRSWSSSPWVRDLAITMENPSGGMGGRRVLLHNRDVEIPPSVLLPVRQPSESGLYSLGGFFRNPHYSPSPQFGFSYDTTQVSASDQFPVLLGFTAAQWSEGRVFGGVSGLKSGSGRVTITHSSQPTLSVNAEIVRGAFSVVGPSQWFTTVRNGAFAVMKHGTMTFRFQDYFGGATHLEQRFVGYGTQGGKHQFLFQLPPAPPTPRKAPATRAE